MSYSLKNALMNFIDLLNKIFKPSLDIFIVVFINDILLYFKTWEKHAMYLELVLQTLKIHQLYAKQQSVTCG